MGGSLFWLPLLGSEPMFAAEIVQTRQFILAANGYSFASQTCSGSSPLCEKATNKPEAFASGLFVGSPCWARTSDNLY
jgi:hypothetical protein